MPPDPALVAETRSWFTKAAKDLGTAAYESQASPPFAEDITFHAQQAAEKALKVSSPGTIALSGVRTTWSSWARLVVGSIPDFSTCCAALRP